METEITSDGKTPGDNTDTNGPGFDFELHYGLAHKTVRDVLEEISTDITSYTTLHNWDEKLTSSPLKELSQVIRRDLYTNDMALDTLLGHSAVEEVLTMGGINHERPALQNAVNVEITVYIIQAAEADFI